MKTRSQTTNERLPPGKDIPTLFAIIDLDPPFISRFEALLLARCPNASRVLLASPEDPSEDGPSSFFPGNPRSNSNNSNHHHHNNNKNNNNSSSNSSRITIDRAREAWIHRLLTFLLLACWSQGVHPVVCIPASKDSRQWQLCYKLIQQLRAHCLPEALDIIVLCGLSIRGEPWSVTARLFADVGASATFNAADTLMNSSSSSSSSSTGQSQMEPPKATTGYFQAQKFSDDGFGRKVAGVVSPREAFQMANSRNSSFKWFWDDQCRCGAIYKERVMAEALLYKFSEKKPLARYSLLATGTCKLVEDSDKDGYWGVGPRKDGLNRLGYLLECVRFETLKDELSRMQCRFDSLFRLKDPSSSSPQH
ncbi:hypothetical protein DFQ27_004927 [Actinomortierella ambigua]|uniref:NADAR domain-containing protein n=1 Tax=Actinomortierella ambigua TaxID=1343610 RepID=A0A9P6Q2X8_9FUNG|nr:hypothetical protein DFQ27_004927 [Actinomortierella ambigua]